MAEYLTPTRVVVDDLASVLDLVDKHVAELYERWRCGDPSLNYWAIYRLQAHTKEVRTDLAAIKQPVAIPVNEDFSNH